jgi:hypothetical protein
MYNWSPFSVLLWQRRWHAFTFDLVNTLAGTSVQLVELQVWMTLECCLKVVYQLKNPSKHDQKDTEGPLLVDFKSHNYTISTNHYCQTALQKLCTKIKNKCSGKLSIIPLDDIVHLYVSRSLQDQQSAMLWVGELVVDIISCLQPILIFTLFSCVLIVKEYPQKSMLLSDSNVQDMVQWCRQQPKELFAHGIYGLVHQWDCCLTTRWLCVTVALTSAIVDASLKKTCTAHFKRYTIFYSFICSYHPQVKSVISF